MTAISETGSRFKIKDTCIYAKEYFLMSSEIDTESHNKYSHKSYLILILLVITIPALSSKIIISSSFVQLLYPFKKEPLFYWLWFASSTGIPGIIMYVNKLFQNIEFNLHVADLYNRLPV